MKVKGKVWRRIKDAEGTEVDREIDFEITPKKGKRADWGFNARYSRQAKGLVVLRISPRGPAARAGIKAGDVITEVNGKSLAHPLMAARVLRAIKPGHTVKGKLRRKAFEGGKQVDKTKSFTLKVGTAR
jgi:S1-C subfamily serine protease